MDLIPLIKMHSLLEILLWCYWQKFGKLAQRTGVVGDSNKQLFLFILLYSMQCKAFFK